METPPRVRPITDSGIPVEELYTPDHLRSVNWNYDTDLGDAGEFPFARGVLPDLYRSAPWIMGQYSGYASPEETNKRFRELISRGQTGFSIALDLPTQMGLDSDDTRARGEVGRVGVPVSCVPDVEALIQGLDLTLVRQIRTSANSIGPMMAAFFIVASEQHGIDPNSFRMMFQNDSLKEYIARGTYIYPPLYGLRLSADLMEYCANHLPKWEPIEFCGYHVRDAGANAVEELAIAFSNGMAYIDECIARGMDVDGFARSIVMFLSAGIDIFEEAAKFRAARRMWARLLSEKYGAHLEDSLRLSLFSYTLGGLMTAQEPINNIARIAYAALSAALGGVQTLATSSFDEALGLPTRAAATLSLRIQQVLAYETGVTRTTDPLGGSFYIERLTSELEARALELIKQIADQGGATRAIETGLIRELIDDGAYAQQKGIESGEIVKVGLNAFTAEHVEAQEIFSRDGIVPENPSINEAKRSRFLADFRSQRDRRQFAGALSELQKNAEKHGNLMDPILTAVRARATLGEICGALREVWGVYGG